MRGVGVQRALCMYVAGFGCQIQPGETSMTAAEYMSVMSIKKFKLSSLSRSARELVAEYGPGSRATRSYRKYRYIHCTTTCNRTSDPGQAYGAGAAPRAEPPLGAVDSSIDRALD